MGLSQIMVRILLEIRLKYIICEQRALHRTLILIMRNLKGFLILVLTLPYLSYSQNEFLDFGITQKNDTIYGTIRYAISNRSVLYEKSSNPEKDKIKFRVRRLSKFKKIRLNDKIYTYEAPSKEDGIYAQISTRTIPKDSVIVRLGDFTNIEKRFPDYVVTTTNDTVYGNIKDPTFGKLQLLDASNVKIKIDSDNIKSFRYDNAIFEYKEKERTTFFDNKAAYLKLILEGPVKLYEYEYEYSHLDINGQRVNSTVYHYYIEKENELTLISGMSYPKKLLELFADNELLVSKIKNKEYVIDNIYLIVKYYNESK